MEYRKTITLRDGSRCCLRSGTAEDAREYLELFILTHTQTDYLLTYPDEGDRTVECKERFLREMAQSADGAEILAVVDGELVGSAGIGCVGHKDKVRHRAEFGISVVRSFWGLGLGRALTEACIECARTAGYAQLELDVVAENERAIELYKSVGFVEFGRNPRGFRTREGYWQELVLMRLELD